MKGRPKKIDPRNIIVKVRMSEAEYRLLTMLSELTGQTKSEVIRDVIFLFSEHIVKHASTKEIKEDAKESCTWCYETYGECPDETCDPMDL